MILKCVLLRFIFMRVRVANELVCIWELTWFARRQQTLTTRFYLKPSADSVQIKPLIESAEWTISRVAESAERESACQFFCLLSITALSSDRSLPAAISNVRMNIPRGLMPELVQNRFQPGVDATTMGRISFCASATFVFTTPPIALTRNERGMRARCAIQMWTGRDSRDSHKFYSTFRATVANEIPRKITSAALQFCHESSESFASVIHNTRFFFLIK